MNRKRRIIEDSDSDDGIEVMDTPAVSKTAYLPVVSLQGRTTRSRKEKEDPRSSDSDGEWKPADISEVMIGVGGSDGKEAIPRKITAEQIGAHGIEYQVHFQNGEGSKNYHEWICEHDLTDEMKILKDKYEDDMTSSNRRNQKKNRPSYAEQMDSGSNESDVWESGDEEDGDEKSYSNEEIDREVKSFSSVKRNSKSSGSRSRHSTDSSTVPDVPSRRSTRNSSTARKAVTRQKLDDLMELRHRSKQGIGALHDVSGSSSSDEDVETYSATAATPALFGGSSRRGSKNFIAGGGPGSGARSTEKNESVDDDDEEADDIDNFIVNSDDEDVYAVYEEDTSDKWVISFMQHHWFM